MTNSSSIILYSEISAIEQRLKGRLTKALPDGMELSHFSVLNHLFSIQRECTPLQLATALKVTKGAMTNTLNRLEQKGYVHIRNDWEDARRKHVAISRSGMIAREIAISSTAPIFDEMGKLFREDEYRQLLSQLRKLRQFLD